jgi:hypothetical protein
MRVFVMPMLLLLAGCGPSFEMSEPPGFVEIENDYDNYDYRATSADGLVIAVRELDHDPEGEAEFWIKAVKNRMRENAGYALLKEVDVVSGDGVKGKQLQFGHDQESGKPHLYYVSVFVTPDKIFLLEAGGSKELVTKNQGKIDQAHKIFRTQ